MLKNRVVLGVTGSIAAFKAAYLASAMVKRGLEVRGILTQGGARFVTPLTFEALTGQLAATDLWDEQPGSSRMGHLELAHWADVLVVAPASAGALSRLALGLSDDLLGAVALASRSPLILAPAMESLMFDHPATQEHLDTLRGRGAVVVGPERGRLASGAEGAGRMSEPDTILEVVLQVLRTRQDLAGRRIVVTAGPTFEPLDPVRFIGNHSSGKMGYAVAEEARARGARVTLIAGPTALPDPPGMTVEHVGTTEEMRNAVLREVKGADAVVMAAAVADFRPAAVAPDKIKRSHAMHLQLVPTSDIAAEAARAEPRAVHVGFALESRDLLTEARRKLESKGLRLVVANAMTDEHNPLGSESNRVALVTRDGAVELPEMPKRQVAERLWDEIAAMLSREE